LLRQFQRWPIGEQLLLPEATWRLIKAERLVKSTTFGDLQRRFASSRGLNATPDEKALLLAMRIGRVVRSAARHLPWECACLAQALAARAMLRRRGLATRLHIGVARLDSTEDALASHAWLTLGDQIITGAEGHERFKEIVCF